MLRRAATLTAAAALAVPATASAADPGRWVLTNVSSIPYTYLQGVASDARTFWFVGPDQGLARTSLTLRQAARVDKVIPRDVSEREGYNHVGDPDWEAAEGGRVLLALECFAPWLRDPNPCRTGSIAVADPATLAWRYYVKLDPAAVPKAMWVAAAPDGLLWTSAGDDLLAFRSSEVSPANAAPAGPALAPAHRIPGAAAGMGVTGAVFHDGRLLLAGPERATNRYILRSVDLATGTTRLEIEHGRGEESEGVAVAPALGGILHWVMSPGLFGSPNELLTYHPAGTRLRLRVAPARIRAGRASTLRARVTSLGTGIRGVAISIAGRRAKTNAAGRARVKLVVRRAGRYRVRATRSGLRSASATLRVTSR